MPKEFKTINELITLLESRGVKTDSDTEIALMRESYYAIVNGYKKPFLDLKAMEKSNEDIYKQGTEFTWMYDLFLFDRDLRALVFKYMAKAEASIRSAIVYSFCFAHQSHNDYLDISNYCDPNEYLVSKHFKGNKEQLFQQNLIRFMGTLNKKLIVKSGTRPFIKHYLNKYNSVPLWVLANDLTFGNMVNMYQLMQVHDRERTCTIIAKENLKENNDYPYLSPRMLLRYAKVLVSFRNICAHDERLYCSKVGNDDLKMALFSLMMIIGSNEFDLFVKELSQLFVRYKGRLHNVTPMSLLGDMGFTVKE